MKTIFTKMNAISKMRIDVVRSLWYSRKWPAVCGRFIVAGRTRVDAGKNGLLREGSVRIGCPKGIFGYIGIPGTDSTLIKVDDGGMLRLGDGVCIYAGGRIIIAGQGCVEIGKDTSIAANTYLLSRNRITIGSGCAISWDCQIMDTDFHEIQDEHDPPAGDARGSCADLQQSNHSQGREHRKQRSHCCKFCCYQGCTCWLHCRRKPCENNQREYLLELIHFYLEV